MSIRVITSFAELDSHRAAWSALLQESASNEPMLSPLWLAAWWRVFGNDDGRRLCAVLVHDGDRLIGLAPLLTRRVWHRGALPLRRIELLASGERQEDEICSEYLAVIAARGREGEVAQQVVGALAGGELGAWDELVLDVMRRDAPMTRHLVHELRCARVPVEVGECRGCPYIALPRSFSQYLAVLPSRHRYLVKRSVRELERWAGGEVQVTWARSAKDLAMGQEILLELHRERWQEAGRAGVFASPRFLAFHREIMPALLARDGLDLMWLSCRGRPIAAVYNILWNRKVYFYQSGRRMDLPKQIRPGIAMHAFALQRAIERGCVEYDFLSGGSQYKRQLATAEAVLVQVRATRPGSLPALAQRWARTGEDALRGMRRR